MTTLTLAYDDRQAIADVMTTYAICLDTRDWARLNDVFAEEVVGEFGNDHLTGRADLVGYISSNLAGCGPSQHLLGNYLIDGDGDRATAVCSARVFHMGARERAILAPYECWGEYHDRFERRAGKWRIVHRRFDVRLQQGDIGVLGG